MRGQRARTARRGQPAIGRVVAACVTVAGLASLGPATTTATLAHRMQAAPGTGNDAVGALFVRSHGRLGGHFCTASVVHSPAGDLLVTAAHCLTGKVLGAANGVVFAPGYADGRYPHGIWVVTSVIVTARWTSSHDPNDDVAFLVVAGAGASVERAAGAESVGFDTSLPATVEARGYPNATSRPVTCSAQAHAYGNRPLRQEMFACGGFTNGTSGGPLLLNVGTDGEGTVIGVIGGYQEGGDTPDISYSAMFASNVAALYRSATAPAPDPARLLTARGQG